MISVVYGAICSMADTDSVSASCLAKTPLTGRFSFHVACVQCLLYLTFLKSNAFRTSQAYFFRGLAITALSTFCHGFFIDHDGRQRGACDQLLGHV